MSDPGWRASVSHLVTPSRELAAVFDERSLQSAWLEPVYAMALVTEHVEGDGDDQQSIMPVCDYGSGELFLGPAVLGYLGVVPVPRSLALPARCTPRNRTLWQSVYRLLRMHHAESEARHDKEGGNVVDLVKRSLLGPLPPMPRPTALKVSMTDARAASLFVMAGGVLVRSRPDLDLASSIERVRVEFDVAVARSGA